MIKLEHKLNIDNSIVCNYTKRWRKMNDELKE